MSTLEDAYINIAREENRLLDQIKKAKPLTFQLK